MRKIINTYVAATRTTLNTTDTPANRRKHAALRAEHDCMTRIGTDDGFLFVVDEILYSRKRVEQMQQKADADLAKARASGYAYSIEACERRKRAADAAAASLEKEVAP